MFFNNYKKEYDELFEFLTEEWRFKKEYVEEFLKFYQKPLGKKLIAYKKVCSGTELFLNEHLESALLVQSQEIFIKQIRAYKKPLNDKVVKTAIAILWNISVSISADLKEEFIKYQETYYPDIYKDVFL
jgi:hypothetical protein